MYDAALEDAQDLYSMACLAWALRVYAVPIAEALLGAGLDGSGSILSAIAEAICPAGSAGPNAPEYWASGWLYSLAQVHADKVLKQLPAGVHPSVRALFDAGLAPGTSAGDGESG